MLVDQEEGKQAGLLRRTSSLSSLPMDRNGWRTQYLGDSSWMDAVKPIFDFFTERTRGSKLEVNDTYFTWHYRNADPFYGESQARAPAAAHGQQLWQVAYRGQHRKQDHPRAQLRRQLFLRGTSPFFFIKNMIN
jgi:hypothetical protein